MKYIFGYGSLIYAGGINGRDMEYVYTEKDLTIAKLKNYKRCWNATYDVSKTMLYVTSEWKTVRFLGIEKSVCHSVNGIIFSINEEDINPFLNSEGVNDDLYFLEDVTDLIESPLKLTSEDRVFTCVTTNPTENGFIKQYYIDSIKEGLDVRGESFKYEFLETTFPKKILKDAYES